MSMLFGAARRASCSKNVAENVRLKARLSPAVAASPSAGAQLSTSGGAVRRKDQVKCRCARSSRRYAPKANRRDHSSLTHVLARSSDRRLSSLAEGSASSTNKLMKKSKVKDAGNTFLKTALKPTPQNEKSVDQPVSISRCQPRRRLFRRIKKPTSA